MSFGFSVGDILLLVELSTRVVVRWRNACGEFNEVCKEVSHIQYLLLRAEKDAKQPDSLLILDEADKEQWSRISEECTDILSDLNKQITKRGSLGTDHKRNWDKLRFNNSKLKDLRRKLASNKESITLFLNMIQTSSLGRMERQTADARTILLEMRDMMDHRASRMRAGKYQASIFSMGSSVDDDEKQFWKEFRKDLLNSGFRPEDVKANAAALKSHLRELIDAGQLDEQEPPQPHRTRNQQSTTQKPKRTSDRNYKPASVEDDKDDSSNDTLSNMPTAATKHSEPLTTVSEECTARIRQGSVSKLENDARRKALSEETKYSWSKLWKGKHNDDSSKLHTTTTQESESSTEAAASDLPGKEQRDSGYSTPNSSEYPQSDEANTISADSAEPGEFDYTSFFDSINQQGNTPMPAYMPYSPRLLEWKRLPVNQIYPLKALPVLPEGWDWRIDDQCRLFYVDSYAKGDEKRCFWRPPLPEPHSPSISTPGWKRVETLFGRVYWVNEDTGRKTYVHPLQDYDITELSGLPYHFDYDLNMWISLKKEDLQNLPCEDDDDSDVFCCLSDQVWNEGISRDAAIVRGDMHWGNHQAGGFASQPSHRIVSQLAQTKNPFSEGDSPDFYVWGHKCKKPGYEN